MEHGPLRQVPRFKHLLGNGLAVHSDEALKRYPYPQGVRVLDIGCGFGDSTQIIARQLGPKGEAVGVDCAANFVSAATQDAKDADGVWAPSSTWFVTARNP